MRSSFEYLVQARVTWTRAEVGILMLLTKMHYDFACKDLGRTGVVAQAAGELDWDPPPGEAPAQEVEVSLTSRTVNLICKLLEMSRYPGIPEAARGLDMSMCALFHAMNAKYLELNPRAP